MGRDHTIFAKVEGAVKFHPDRRTYAHLGRAVADPPAQAAE